MLYIPTTGGPLHIKWGFLAVLGIEHKWSTTEVHPNPKVVQFKIQYYEKLNFQLQRLMSVTPATQEAEASGLQVRGQPEQLRETCLK